MFSVEALEWLLSFLQSLYTKTQDSEINVPEYLLSSLPRLADAELSEQRPSSSLGPLVPQLLCLVAYM